MDERRGGWGRLLALFRLSTAATERLGSRGRGGKLFDPGCLSVPRRAGRARRSRRAATGLRRLHPAHPRWLLTRALGRRAAVLPHARRRADRQRLRDSDGLHGRDAPGPRARDQGRQEQPHAGLRRSRRLAGAKRRGAREVSEGRGRPQSADRQGRPRRSRRPRTRPALAAALRPIVDERGSPGGTSSPPGTPCCSRPTSAAAPAATTRRAADRADRARTRWSRPSSGSGRDATPGADARPQGLRPGHGLRRLPGRGLPRSWRRGWSRPGRASRRRGRRSRPTRTRSCTRAAWSRSAASMASTRTRWPSTSPAVAVARDARARPRVHLPRPRAEIRRQPRRADARRRSRRRIGIRRSPACRCSGKLVKDRVAEATKARAEIQAIRRATKNMAHT